MHSVGVYEGQSEQDKNGIKVRIDKTKNTHGNSKLMETLSCTSCTILT